MKVFILAFFLLASLPAFSQSGNLHMIEMSTNNAALGSLTFSESDSSGSKSSTSSLMFSGNYAYRVTPRLQAGIEGSYARFKTTTTYEYYDAMVGLTYNFHDDLTKAFFISAYGGFSWNHSYASNITKGKHGESLQGELTFGKRFPLTNIGLASVTYSPEISYTRSETRKTYDSHTNTLSIRFLQFAVFF
jgi:hypothetical protein